jgi:DNA-binding LacI/PurR family transcriptional regulator
MKLLRPGEVYLALSQIVRGLRPGEKMPSYKTLMQQLEVPQRSLDIAYERLEAEGVLERRWGDGTYVLDPCAEGMFLFLIRSVAVTGDLGASVRQMYLAFDRLVRERYPSSTLELLVMRAGDTPDSWPEDDLHRFIRALHGQVRLLGIFAGFTISDQMQAFCDEHCLPIVSLSGRRILPHSVQFSATQAVIEFGLRHLLDEGWREIAIISPQHSHTVDFLCAMDSIPHILSEYGLDHTSVTCHAASDVQRSHAAGDGAAFIQEMLEQERLPQALVITDDVLCKQMIFGALEVGVKLAEHYALVTLSNAGIPIVASRPLTCVEVNGRAVAEEAMSVMEQLFRNESPLQRQPIMPSLIIGRSSRREYYRGM